MGLYGSPYDYIIHAALIVTSHMLLITSFQPPLGCAHVKDQSSGRDVITCSYLDNTTIQEQYD